MTGHLEPRDSPEPDHKPISDPKWANLLWYGHTFDGDDCIMNWYDIEGKDEPPEELIDRKRDAELRNTVIDYYTREKIAERLRESIHECYQAWAEQPLLPGLSKEKREEIKTNLKKKKVILCDDKGADYTLEQTPGDVLEYAREQLDIARNLKNNDSKNELLRRQRKVYVLSKYLIIPQILDKSLSTKGRGITIALA